VDPKDKILKRCSSTGNRAFHGENKFPSEASKETGLLELKLMFHKRKDHIPHLRLILLILLLAIFYGNNGNAEPYSFKRIVKERIIGSVDSSNIIPDSFSVSPDGRRVAYIIKIGNRQVFVVDDLKQKAYDEIKLDYFGPQFSPDSTRIGYFAREDNRWFFVIDGKEQKEYQPEASLSVYYSE
jgi:hypothetical protein